MEVLLGKRDRLTPPKRIQKWAGLGDFRAKGDHFLRLFREVAELQRDERILEVGCGPGRLAIPLARYLDSDGSYEGFDVWREGIDWCRRHVTRRYPNVRFQHKDVYSGLYHPAGRIRPEELSFPYEDSSFDFVILNSVFTHMLPDGVARYLLEVSRILRPDGRAFITWFLLDDETRALVAGGRPVITPAGVRLEFRHDHGSYRTTSEEAPERAVAYESQYVSGAYAEAGLTIKQPILYGGWRGRAGLSYQDITLTTTA
jgi:SAM-dependent methyltransferase